MVEAVLRARRRRTGERRIAMAAARYAALGWPICPGAHPGGDQPHEAGGRACSCDRVGCPAPGAHPVSPAWQAQATSDPAVVSQWWSEQPQASIVLVTGRLFDVLDVPTAAGLAALTRLDRAGVATGPVALSAGDRALFFVRSRAAVSDQDEWWSCHLDCEPETDPSISGLRWHCRDSYVIAPPSRLSGGATARWLIEPGTPALPDALRLLEYLADACEEISS